MFQKGLFIDEPKVRLDERRSAMMEPTKWRSSKGIWYTKSIVRTSNTQPLNTVINNCGVMEHLEELTIIGRCYDVGGMWQSGAPSPSWKTNFPNLKILRLKPTANANSTAQSGGYFSLGHYIFSGLPDCTEYVEIGSMNGEGLWFNTGGYFRNDMPRPPGTATTNVGNTNGLTLVVYRSSYHANGGFQNGTTAPNTTIIQYHYQTGEILTV